jgi:hypothetical protein
VIGSLLQGVPRVSAGNRSAVADKCERAIRGGLSAGIKCVGYCKKVQYHPWALSRAR